MNPPAAKRGRLQLLGIAAVFLGPLLLATWMYRSGALVPAGFSNHGALIEPVVSIRDELPASPLNSLANGQWVLLYASDTACADPCREALHRCGRPA